jgi:hypothetical protein
MKKAATLLLLILITFSLKSQEYYSLLEINKSWNVLSVQYIPGDPYYDTTYSTISYKLMGDTLINSLSYFKLYKSEEEFPENWTIDAFLREDDQKKIWMLKEINEEEYLLYDFDIQQGDVIEVGYYDPVSLTVDSITVVEVGGTDRLKYWFSYDDYYKETWITGIGSSKGIIFSGSTFIVGGWYWLLCASQQEEVYYSNPNYESCYLVTSIESLTNPSLLTYPNPAENIIRFEMPESQQNSIVFISDIQGRNIAELFIDSHLDHFYWNCKNVKSGIYFYRTEINDHIYQGKILIQ